MTLLALGQFLLIAEAGPATRVPGEGVEAKQIQGVRTGKERLGGKASDEQRVDNCNVPLELRGPTPRPDDCPAGAPR
jgi:hypothetical protein